MYRIKRFVWLIVVLSLAVFSLFFFLGGHFCNPNASDVWGDVGKMVSVVTLFAILFERWLWKLPICLNLIVPMPCVEGPWKGTIKYRQEGSEGIHTKSINVKIRQSFLNLHVEARTDESASKSVCATFNIDDARDVKQLVSLYSV